MKKLIFQTVLAGFLLLLCPEWLKGAEEDIQEYFSIVGPYDTNVGGLICTDTTWTAAGSPYIVTSSILIGCNATLTIEPDVVVRFDPQMAIVVGHSMWGKGTLVARGTAESPITFTSNTGPNPGDWSRIHFTDYAVDATFDGSGNYTGGCILEHCIIEYAGFGNYAAIFAEKSSPFLNFCEVRHNSYYGIQVDGTSAPFIRITNCKVWDHPQCGIYILGGTGGNRLLNNNIYNNRDGGIYFGSAASNTLTGNTLSNNASSGSGGGIYFDSSGSNTITGNTITGNTGTYYGGGGIYFNYSGSNTLTGNTISNNASSGHGGGIYFHCSGSNTLTGNTISSNTSGWDGGGIFGYYSGSNTLTGNTISDNTTDGPGGGIYFEYSSGSNTITGNTITGNTAAGAGGGIYFGSSGGNTLSGNTITDNTSSTAGGGIYFGSSGSNTLAGNLLETNTSINGLGGAVYIGSSGDTAFSRNTIVDNYIMTGITGGIYVTGDSQRVSLAGNPDSDSYNIIWGNDGYEIYNDNGFRADGLNDIDARYVQWGTCSIPEIEDHVYHYFDNATKAFVVYYPFVCPGDFDLDLVVNYADLDILTDNWLRNNCNIPDWCEGTDLDLTYTVDFFDFAIFAENWLEEI